MEVGEEIHSGITEESKQSPVKRAMSVNLSSRLATPKAKEEMRVATNVAQTYKMKDLIFGLEETEEDETMHLSCYDPFSPHDEKWVYLPIYEVKGQLTS